MEAQLLATLIVALVLWIVYGQPECRMQQGTSTTYQAAPVERTRAVSSVVGRSVRRASIDPSFESIVILTFGSSICSKGDLEDKHPTADVHTRSSVDSRSC